MYFLLAFILFNFSMAAAADVAQVLQDMKDRHAAYESIDGVNMACRHTCACGSTITKCMWNPHDHYHAHVLAHDPAHVTTVTLLDRILKHAQVRSALTRISAA